MKSSFRSLKTKISLAIFLVLVISFSAFILVITKYNSTLYSTQIQREILSTFKLNVEKVDRYTMSMQQKATDLALTGEAFYKLKQRMPDANLNDEVQEYLVDNYRSFPEAIGGGVWYDPYVFYQDQQYYGPYAYWSGNEVLFTWDLNTPEYDYHTQDWYTLALPSDWDRNKTRDSEYYWTAPYWDEAGSLSLMITVDAFMRDDAGQIIGISTADWALDEMLLFLESTNITPDSHTFLIDTQLDTIIANTLDRDLIMQKTSNAVWMNNFLDAKKGKIQEADINIENTDYKSYYTITEVGMLYGILIPTSTLQEPIIMLATLNSVMAVTLGFFLLFVLYLVLSWITNPISKLTEAVDRVSKGDLDTTIDRTSNDEIGRLASNFNQLTKALALKKRELTEYHETLEHKVKERTAEIEKKNSELERFNKITVGRELKMVELKKKIEEMEGQK